jgi:misacylated tRNA(Ala) deacylase
MSKDYDPRMHTAEHILNQTMVRMFNRGRSFSAHIEKKKSKCDYRFDRNLSGKELIEIESRVNDIIGKDLQVTEQFLPRIEAEKYYKLEKLPEEAGDNMRIIKVGDYDACPCIGMHVHSTKEIGKFKIISSAHEDGVLRIRFKLNEDSE